MAEQLKMRSYTGWRLIKAYWQSEQRLSASTLLISVLFFSVTIVGLDVALTTWSNYFYNALQDYNKHAAFSLLIIFVFLAAIYIVFAVYRYYLQQFLGLRWRRWLTQYFLDHWLANRHYYYLEHADKQTDNPDQRLQEDINSLVLLSLSLGIGFVTSIITIAAFLYVLWKLSGTIILPIGHWGALHIPGYLVWVGIIYAAIGTTITFKIGRPLVSLNFEQQRREATFRFAAIDLRSHAEHVALYRGEQDQKTILQKIFSSVLDNWYAIILRQKLLLWFTAGYNQVAVVLPLVVALPNYFNKVFKLGGLIQAIRAFSQIQEALSFLVNSYTTMAEWRAVMQRLLTFLNHMYQIEQITLKSNTFTFSQNSQNKIITKNLTLKTPHDHILLEKINLELVQGQHYILTGASGIGKSTLLRGLANIWLYGSGEISLPATQTIMFLPQLSYMPLGTLKEALLFPDTSMNVTDTVIIKLLNDCNLLNLVNQLHQTSRWSNTLSPGELQRIAFVRVLIHQPDWVFFDESTSALDLANEKNLYELLKTALPHCSIVSVGHRPSLAAYHDQTINLENYMPQQPT